MENFSLRNNVENLMCSVNRMFVFHSFMPSSVAFIGTNRQHFFFLYFLQKPNPRRGGAVSRRFGCVGTLDEGPPQTVTNHHASEILKASYLSIYLPCSLQVPYVYAPLHIHSRGSFAAPPPLKAASAADRLSALDFGGENRRWRSAYHGDGLCTIGG